MITYTVRYRKCGSWFWKKIKKVKGDSVLSESKARLFILEDETRREIPTDCEFEFSKERFLSITERMELEARQKITLNPR
jgi:hypothetical protein